MTDPACSDATTWEELPSHVQTRPLQSALSFDVFYVSEFSSLAALARALTGSAAAEDIAQDAMIAAYRRWNEIQQLDVPAAWVRRICANLSTSFIRRRAAEARAVLRAGGMRTHETELPPADEEFWAEVRRLPRRQAQALSLHYIYDMQVCDIALTLDCSESTVKAHLVRGRAAMSRRLTTNEEDRP